MLDKEKAIEMLRYLAFRIEQMHEHELSAFRKAGAVEDALAEQANDNGIINELWKDIENA